MRRQNKYPYYSDNLSYCPCKLSVFKYKFRLFLSWMCRKRPLQLALCLIIFLWVIYLLSSKSDHRILVTTRTTLQQHNFIGLGHEAVIGDRADAAEKVDSEAAAAAVSAGQAEMLRAELTANNSQALAALLKPGRKRLSSGYNSSSAVHPLDLLAYFKSVPRLSQVMKEVARETLGRVLGDSADFRDHVMVARPSGVCDCVVYTCSCCRVVGLAQLHYTCLVCLNLTYVPNMQVLTYKLIEEKDVVANGSMPVLAAGDVCVSVRGDVTLCGALTNVSTTVDIHHPDHKLHMSACAVFILEIFRIPVQVFPLGCFNMPDRTHLKEQQKHPLIHHWIP